jgi:hypothetical protein
MCGTYTGFRRSRRLDITEPRDDNPDASAEAGRAHMVFRSPFPAVTIPDMPLTDFVLAEAGAYPDRPALVDGPTGRGISYGELLEGIRRLAAGLAARGVA